MTKSGPIMEFNDNRQLMKCMRYWKKVLFLDHWIIKVALVDREECKAGGEECSGTNHFQISGSSSMIFIATPDDDIRGRIVKYCAEKTLVHELLHCKYNWVSETGTQEGKYYENLEHSLIEQMSKSLIMAKYGLTASWFENF